MDLKTQIEQQRKKTVADSYSMSIGEVVSLYEAGDLDIHPEFQRVYRWTDGQKTRLIESILLGIPLPSFFVSSRDDGVWDVVDGVQRLSTIFSFLGVYKGEGTEPLDKLKLLATEQLPALEGLTSDDISKDILRSFKREKINLVIIKKESDSQTKYELFQRLNTNGSPLSDQEVRNCILIMENPDFYEWFASLGATPDFLDTLSITERLSDEKYQLELLSRFLVFTQIKIKKNDELRELGSYVTNQMRVIAASNSNNLKNAKTRFELVFNKLNDALSDDSFRRYEKNKYGGAFKLSVFEVLALGLGQLTLKELDLVSKEKIMEVSKQLAKNPRYIANSGSGKSASNRLKALINLGEALFKS